MYCGAQMKVLKDVTVADLLEAIPDSMLHAKVKVMTGDKFYIHFDIDGEYINIHTKACTPDYGSVTAKNCNSCNKYKNDKCTCTGEGCINFENLYSSKSVIEDKKTKTAEELKNKEVAMQQMKEEYVCDETGPVAPIPVTEERTPVKEDQKVVQTAPEEDEPVAVNGVPFMDIPQFIQDYNDKRSGKKNKVKQTECKPIIDDNERIVFGPQTELKPIKEEKKKTIEPVVVVDDNMNKAVEAAMKNVLEKMLKALD